MKSKTIYSRIEPDGRLTQLTEAGWIEAPRGELGPNFPAGEPAYDPENPPLTPERLAKMRRISKAKFVRRKLGLSQQEFADLYQIPVGTLRDWEQYRTEPDATAKAYLKVIAADPDMIAAMLKPKGMAAE
jgi:putative transcriptional regulator